MISRKPVIGVVGGVGSGKSQVARILGDLGAAWLSADELAHEAYQAESVKATIRSIWGPEVFTAASEVDRKALAQRVFASQSDLRRLEMVIHPWIARRRDEICTSLASRPDIKAFVADSPLLFEANLDVECDCILFVDCDLEIRARRVRETRGWNKQELLRREKRQLPLDFKRDRADYIVDNNSDLEALVRAVQCVWARILNPVCE
jgi:dephospho-CoA kinase